MPAFKTNDTGGAKGGLPWYAWDVVLLGVLFLFATFGNALPLLSYLGGLRNDKDLALVWLVLLTPVAFICLVALIVRIVCSWPLRIVRLRRLIVLQIVVSLGTLAYVGLPFLLLLYGPPGYKTHMWGMRKYVRTQVDVAAIRAWLGALDPNDWHGVRIDVRRDEECRPVLVPDDVVLPPCLLRLEPRYVALSSVEDGGLSVILTWGSGFLGTWHVAIGPETMRTLPSELVRAASFRLDVSPYDIEVSPGVHIWHDIE